MRSGPIKEAINRYKYQDKRAWAVIFARVLVGYLEDHRHIFKDFDLIVASPTFVSDEGEARRWDHTRLVLQKAHAVFRKGHGRSTSTILPLLSRHSKLDA